LGVRITQHDTKGSLLRKIREVKTKTEEATGTTSVDFGKHFGKTYQEIKDHQPTYARWVLEAFNDGDSSPQLQRLARWLRTDKMTGPVAMEEEIPSSAAEPRHRQRKATGTPSDTDSETPAHLQEMATAIGGMAAAMRDFGARVERLEAVKACGVAAGTEDPSEYWIVGSVTPQP
jgi:hypothetical protein